MEKTLVIPGEHVSSYEEAEPGENCYSENDEVYSAAFGEVTSNEGKANVLGKGRTLVKPAVGMDVYGLIIKAGMNKAIAGCVLASEVDGQGRGLEFEAVLPVTAVRRGYVPDIRSEVKVGDIIKARIQKVERTGIEINMAWPAYGVVQAFCPRCRHRMELLSSIFVCISCSWKERRKLPMQGAQDPHATGEGPQDQQQYSHPYQQYSSGTRYGSSYGGAGGAGERPGYSSSGSGSYGGGRNRGSGSRYGGSRHGSRYGGGHGRRPEGRPQSQYQSQSQPRPFRRRDGASFNDSQ